MPCVVPAACGSIEAIAECEPRASRHRRGVRHRHAVIVQVHLSARGRARATVRSRVRHSTDCRAARLKPRVCGRSVCGHRLHLDVGLQSGRRDRRGRRSGDGGIGPGRRRRRWRRRERDRDSSVLNKCRNTGCELHDRFHALSLRPCDRSEDAFDVVHARDRLREALESCRRRRHGGERNRVRAASGSGPGGSESSSGDGLSVPGERIGARRLRPAPADDRSEVATGLDSASEVGRRSVGDFGARELHGNTVRAHRRVALGVDINDNVFDVVDVDVRPSVGGERGDREVIGLNHEVDGGASGARSNAESLSPGLGVGVEDEGVGNGVGGLVSVAGVGVGDGVVAPRLVAGKDVQLGLHRCCRDAGLRHLRWLDELDFGHGASGAEDTRRSWGGHAKKPLCHHHSRTLIQRHVALLANCRLLRSLSRERRPIRATSGAAKRQCHRRCAG